MAENVFEAVKQSVSTREAAKFYGIKVSRTGMACCPFHDDKNPSMKVDQRFHCFGCGEDGDVIDFTAKLFNLSPKEAAEKLAQDFGLIYDSQAPPRRRYVRQKNEAQKFREDRQRCYRVLSDYYYLLKKWETDRSPRTPEEEPHPRFVEAIQKRTYVEYLLDLFLYESEEEQKAWIAEHTAEITHLERRLKIMAENKPTNRERLREITDGIEQGIKELFESEKYMRYLSVMWHTARRVTLRNSGKNMRKKFCSTRLLRMPLMRWESRSFPRSKSCRRSTRNCWKKRKRPMPSTGVPVRKCGSF